MKFRPLHDRVVIRRSFADRHQTLARQFGIPFARLRPPIEGGDWNDVHRGQSR
jgi:hypothetical protein